MTEVIDSQVIDQIKQRTGILKKFSDRTNDDLFYLNSKTGWIRVISSVNVDAWDPDKMTGNPYQTEPFKDFGSPNLAKQYILAGPVNYDLDKNEISLKSGINYSGKSSNTLYNLDPTTGYRPAPGITDFTIASKNTYGTLREATVNFVVWSLQELNDIEKLYFRPGYSVIIEWGHSLYVDNEGKVELSPSFNSSLSTYFETNTFKDISDILISNKNKHSYNYDALIGLIKNFSWSFRPDGGYDCSISVTSLGEVLESLTVRLPPPVIPKLDIDETDNKKLRTFIDLFIHELENDIASTGKITISDFEDTSYVKQVFLTRKLVRSDEVIACGLKLDSEGELVYYIPIRIFLILVNISFSIGYDNDKCEDYKSLVSFDTRPLAGGEYNTFPDHFSLDPLISILPKIPQIKKTITTSTGDKVERNTSVYITKDQLHDNIINGNSASYPDYIANINITSDLIRKTLDSYLTPTGDYYEFSVYSFVKAIVEEINRSLGITELDLTYDEVSFLYSIVDRRKTLSDKIAEVPQITLAGLESPLLNVQIQSKISNKLGSMISIAAQSSRTNYLQSTGLWTQYNKGIVDRHARVKEVLKKDCFPEPATKKDKQTLLDRFVNWIKSYFTKSEDTSPVPESEKDEFTKFMETAESAYKAFLSYTFDDPTSSDINFAFNVQVGKYDSELFIFLKNVGPRFFNEMIGSFLEETGEPERGLIPVELNMTMDGIGGLKIGQNFKIFGEFIPEKFNNYGYIITGLDHSIKDNKWITNIKTQTYLLKGDNKPKYIRREQSETQAQQQSSSATQPSNLSESVNNAITSLNLRFPYQSTACVSSGYGPRWGRQHRGTDFVARTGNINIVASADGTILQVTRGCTVGNAGCGGGWGNYVRVDHGNGISTLYGHLSSVTAKNVGSRVTRGEVIGIQGTTGRSTGPHLHYEIIVNSTGQRANPCSFIRCTSCT